jgi:hypothetical protein
MANRRILLTVAALSAAVVIALPGIVLAKDNTSNTTTPEQETHTDTSTDRTESQRDRNKTTSNESATDDSEHKSTGEHRLLDAKLRVCKARAKNITGIMNGNVGRTEKQIELFSKIAERTETFYTNKGKTVANYDELVAAVDSAKATAQADVASLKTLVGDGFDCSGSDPKGTAASVKAAIEKTRTDMKAYKTAVKNLIVAVKSAQGDAQ